MLEAVDATRFADTRVGRLSGGEQQRILIAHALIARPRLLLLDEPLANLDLRSANEVVALLARITREQEIAVLISAHEMNPLLAVMDRIVYLASGRAASGHDRGGSAGGRAQRALRPPRRCPRRPRPRTVVAGAGEDSDLSRPRGALPGGGARVVSQFSAAVFAPGLFHSQAVHTAVEIGALVAIVTAIVGVFTVMRGQSFAGEALGDIGTTGGSAAFLAGVGPLVGFVVIDVLAAGAMEMIGIQNPRGRDLATGIVLGAGIGLAALFLYLDTTYHNTTGATVTILFGSVFAIAGSTVPLILLLSLIVFATILVIQRPLLLSTVSPDMAAARGIRVRLVGAAYLLALALAMALAAITIGAILSTALLVGPAATALRLTKRPLLAMLAAASIGVAVMWLGIVLAYDSYEWPPAGHGWPVSFFVVTLVFVLYLLSGRVGAAAATPQRG